MREKRKKTLNLILYVVEVKTLTICTVFEKKAAIKVHIVSESFLLLLLQDLVGLFLVTAPSAENTVHY